MENIAEVIIVASNRGPVEHIIHEDRSFTTERGKGGLITALQFLGAQVKCLLWISAAMTEGDRAAAERVGNPYMPDGEKNIQPRYVTVPKGQYNKYYNKIANPLLWFIQHNMWNPPYTPDIDKNVWDAWENGYVPVNEAFAGEIIKSAGQVPDAPIMIQDYQLYLVGKMLRKAMPEVVITHFLHIPWPGPFCWRMLPEKMVLDILSSLLSCDIVGFQTKRDAKAFLATCEEFLQSLHSFEINYKEQTIAYNGRTTHIRSYPISINLEETRALAYSEEADSCIEALGPYLKEKTIVRVDRMDPSKNIIRGFMAYDKLLAQYPEWRERVSFLAFLVPSREDIQVYRDYRSKVEDIIEEINNRYGSERWQPITSFFEDNQAQAFAAMRIYDVLMVNPIADGMNLVAKEGAVINESNGILVLSRSAGAFEELEPGVLAVSATDTEGMFEALYIALCMGEDSKKAKSHFLRNAVENNDINKWLAQQLEDIATLTQSDN